MTRAATLQPDLILMDIRLQGEIDGITAAQQIRMHSHIPIIYLTSHNDPQHIVGRAALTASYGYVTKPYRPQELRAAIQIALAKSAVEHSLEESEQWFGATLRCVADAVIATDHAGRVRFMNPTAEALTEMPLAAALGHRIEFVLRIESYARHAAEPSAQCFTRRHSDHSSVRRRITGACGRQSKINYSAAPILDKAGRLLGSGHGAPGCFRARVNT